MKHRESVEGREEHREAERERRERSCARVADQTSKNLTRTAHTVCESEVSNEKQSDETVLPSPPRQVIFRPAVSSPETIGVAVQSGITFDAESQNRIPNPVCIVCGQGGGIPVRMVDRPFGGHTRGPPWSAW